LPSGLELDTFAIDGNPGDASGNAVATGDLTTGVDIGVVGANSTVEITMQVHAAGPPDDEDLGWVIQPQWSYSYVSCVGEDPLTEPYFAQDVVIDYVPGPATTSDSGGGSDGSGTGADTSGGSESASASASAEDGDASASATVTVTDTDSADGGSGDSSGSASAGVGGDDSGCNCSSEPRSGLGWLGLVVLGVFRRRR
jgi:MYXO-CTERM domain-containing protein